MSAYGNYKLAAYVREFGPGMLAHTGVTRALRALHAPETMLCSADESKWQYVVQWLLDNFSDCIVDYNEKRDYDSLKRLDSQSPIWIFWWQGVDQAPQLVKACIQSIERNAGGHPVVVITEDNLDDNVQLDGRILDKAKKGTISLTHLSDIIRFSLMSQRGGYWFDSTMYMTSRFPDGALELPYFTQALGFGPGPWTDFFQGSGEGNPFTTSVQNILVKYNLVHEQVVTYLLVDCCMRAVYKYSNDYANMVTAAPNLGNDMFSLSKILDQPYSEEIWKSAKTNSFISKLSYKEKHPVQIGGTQTFYGKLISDGGLPR